MGGQALNGIPAAAAVPAGAPTVVQELKHDRSQALRSMHASQLDPNGKGPQPHRKPLPPHTSSRGVTASGSIQSSSAGTAMPNTSTNFEGIGNLDGVLPPDTNGDIGPHNYVQWVNVHYQIFDRSGNSLLGPSPGNTLWSGFGGVCDTTNQGDPVVRYDRMADRWVFTQFAFTTDRAGNAVAPYVQCFAISTTGDPTGSYYRYAFQISTTLFNDYPKLAVWPDAFYMTFNYFNLSLPAASQFQGAGAWAFDRSKMLNGQAATAINFQTTEGGGLLASDLDGSILPPTGSPNYFAAIDTPISSAGVGLAGNTLKIWKFHVDWTTPSNSTFGNATHLPDYNLTVASYKWDPCNGSQNCVTQPGTTVGVDTLSDRLMNRLQYRHFADGHESLVANHSVGVGTSGNQLAVRWYEIRNLSTTPTIYQQGTYQPDSNNRWMGSIAIDKAGDIGVGYSVSSSTVYPSIRYTGRLASDPLGTLPQGEGTIVAGSGSQTSTYYRWGDYSMMAVDPTDDCTFWYTQEYYAATSDRGWRTRVGSFSFPNCNQGWFASYQTSATPTNWTANQSQSYTITLTNSGNQTWPATGANPVHLGIHFASKGGGAASNYPWATDQRFSLPADLAPGGSVTLTVAVNPPGASGSYVLEVQMVKENQFWFAQFADTNVTVNVGFAATYDTSATPTTWTASQSQSYNITLTNSGNQTWPATGANPVHLGIHFASKGGGAASNYPWATDQRFSLPADLAPGGSVTLNVAVNPPGASGSYVLEAQMVKENQFWFAQFADTNVTVGVGFAATYDTSAAPTSWTANQSQSYNITLTNSGNQTWPAAGANPVHLGIHFASKGGGAASNYPWATDQRFFLPADLAPGGSVTLNVAVNPPGASGNYVLEAQMVKENQFWFAQFADVSVTVH